MRRFRTRPSPAVSPGFTLLEVLLVVAIIAILAAIAVYNLGDAQTRAKVARAKTDMRTISVALEAYAVDYNDYPPNAIMPPDDDPVELAKWPPGSGLSFTPVQITTPIAYITSLPEDPFKVAAGDVYGVGSISALGRRGYDYYRIITPGEWWGFQNGAATGRPSLVSFVAVHSDGQVLGPDGQMMDFGNRGAFSKYGHWMQWSIGPDRIPWTWEKDFQVAGDPASPLKSPPYEPNYYSFDVNYDPTNGTVSFGNITRTQAGSEGLRFDASPDPRPTDDPGPDGPEPPDGGPDGTGSGSEAGDAKSAAGGASGAISPRGAGPGGAGPGASPPGGSSSQHSSSRRVLEIPPLPGTIKGADRPREVDIAAPDGMIRLLEKFPGSGYKRTRKERLRWPDMREISTALLLLGLALLLAYVIYRMLRKPQYAEEIYNGSIMDDSSLAYLAKLGPVKTLHLAESKVTDAGLAHVASMDTLESINLWGTEIGDQGLHQLRGLSNMKELILGGCRVTDAGLKSLLKMERLEMLTLCGAPLTDKSVSVLRRMKSLRLLNLRGTKLTPRAIKELSAALPECVIQSGELEAAPPSGK